MKHKRPSHRPTANRSRQNQWRERVPDLLQTVEQHMPQAFAAAAQRRADDLPEAWRALVQTMRAEVHASAVQRATIVPKEPLTARMGYEWSWKVSKVEDMIQLLLKTILADIGFEDGATIGSMILVQQALEQLCLELQDGEGDGREDSIENRYRVTQAIAILNPRCDDIHLKRLRALQAAESAARLTYVRSDAEVNESLRELAKLDKALDLEASRDWMENTTPVVFGVLARSWLAAVDERFGHLDPLIVVEEFTAATAESKGGRSENGDGRAGTTRALARLAVSCGALDYAQRDDEGFDTAVDRARANLLMTRSRIRKAIREFPGYASDSEEATSDPCGDEG